MTSNIGESSRPSSFPQARAPSGPKRGVCLSLAGGNPGRGILDSRLRGNDDERQNQGLTRHQDCMTRIWLHQVVETEDKIDATFCEPRKQPRL